MKINKKIYIIILTGIYIFFISIFNVKALTYNVELSYKGNVLVSEQAGDIDLVTSGLPAKEIVIDINKNIICDTDYCVITIPYAISWESNDGQTAHEDIKSFYAITWGASPNSSCSLNSGTIDCIVAKNTNLPKLEIFISPIEAHPYTTLTYRVGGYCNIYNMVNVGSSINNIENKMNEDISSSDKQAPDQTQYNTAKQQEDNIIQSISNVSPNDITFSQDLQATNKIWETTTRFLQTNAKVMGLVISILSIGIIKLIMNR